MKNLAETTVYLTEIQKITKQKLDNKKKGQKIETSWIIKINMDRKFRSYGRAWMTENNNFFSSIQLPEKTMDNLQETRVNDNQSSLLILPLVSLF